MQDARQVESRLVSSLPPHIAFLDGRNILPGLQETFDLIVEVFGVEGGKNRKNEGPIHFRPEHPLFAGVGLRAIR